MGTEFPLFSETFFFFFFFSFFSFCNSERDGEGKGRWGRGHVCMYVRQGIDHPTNGIYISKRGKPFTFLFSTSCLAGGVFWDTWLDRSRETPQIYLHTCIAHGR